MGVQLYSNAPFNWASADNLGFIWDLRRRFKVCVACGGRRSIDAGGNWGLPH